MKKKRKILTKMTILCSLMSMDAHMDKTVYPCKETVKSWELLEDYLSDRMGQD